MKKLILIAVLSITILAKDDKKSKIDFIGGIWYQNGQILNGTFNYSDDIDNFWLQKAFANLGLNIGINRWFSITAALEANWRFPFNKKNTSLESRLYSYDYYLDQLRADITPFQNRFIKLRLTLGYFHFHYNENTRNLGNVLFKSSCYPTAIIQQEFYQQEFDPQKGYDVPFLRLCGYNLSATLLDGLFFYDFLTTMYVDTYHLGDRSLTYILGLYWHGIKVSTGIQFDRFLSFKNVATSPENTYLTDEENSDSEQPTFAGNKFMTYASLDIKRILFGEDYPSFFGENDAKFFFEMNVLGIKNYKVYYNNRKERIPIVFGVLLPIFKILDVLCVEFEHFGSLYPNSMDRPFNYNKAISRISGISIHP